MPKNQRGNKVQKIDELLEAVSIYFDAIYYCDAEKLDQVFHDSSSLFDADEGKVFVDPIASFRKDVDTRPSPSGRSQVRSDEVISIDWLSSLSAIVKLRLQSHQNVFVDHLAFVKGNTGWKIVAKIWHLESTAEIVTET